jgi:ATP adenylyltransferase
VFTKKWIMVVPRRQEEYESCSVNSVGFAGMLLTKTEEQMKFLKSAGVLKVLAEVGFPVARL